MVFRNKSLQLIKSLGSMSRQKRVILTWLITTIEQHNGSINSYEAISKGSGVPLGTTTRIMQQLQEMSLIERNGCEFYLGKLLRL